MLDGGALLPVQNVVAQAPPRYLTPAQPTAASRGCGESGSVVRKEKPHPTAPESMDT
jgi:hypothetical protein